MSDYTDEEMREARRANPRTKAIDDLVAGYGLDPLRVQAFTIDRGGAIIRADVKVWHDDDSWSIETRHATWKGD